MIWGEFVGCFYKMFEIEHFVEKRQKDTHSKEEPENLNLSFTNKTLIFNR